MINNITKIFVFVDDFTKIYNAVSTKLVKTINKRNRKGNMSLSELITIIICFHLSDFRTFKHYYIYYIGKQYKHLFPKLVFSHVKLTP